MFFRVWTPICVIFFSGNVCCDVFEEARKMPERLMVVQGLTELYGGFSNNSTLSEKNLFNRSTNALKYVLRENWCGVISNIDNRRKTIYAHLFAEGDTYTYTMNADMIRYSAEYDRNKGVVVFIHGFRTKPLDDKNIIAIGQSLMLEGTYNVIIFDGSEFIDLTGFEYQIARNQVNYLGRKLAEFLAKMGTDPSKIYLVGHSLGAHIAGVAGTVYKRLTGSRIDRITGLDPAAPCFLQSSDDGKLTKDDAEFVDIMHTNGDIFGILNATGTVDFYPNGGSHQTGCVILSCSHVRVLMFYLASIERDIFMAVKCENSTNIFEENKCKIRSKKLTTNEMGFHANRNNPGIYFLTTGPVYPYGRGKYGLGIPHMEYLEGEVNENEVEKA